MSFRDDREAALQRADALEQELKRVQQEVETLRGPRRPVGPVVLAALLGVLTLGGAAGVVSWLSQRSAAQAHLAAAERAEVAQRAAAQAAELAAAELAIADATRSRALPGRPTAVPVAPAGPVAELVWHGTVDQAVGVALAPGAACTFEGVFARVGDSVAPRALTVQCGGQVLYRSGADVSAADFALREGPIFGAATHEYTLRYHDERDGQSARVAVSTHTHTATVWREGDAALRVTIFVRETSDPREGEALGGRGPTRGPSFAGAIEQAVRVTAVRGHAPVAAGARCTFAVRPVWEYPENCRMVVRCGETWLYGARESGYLTCEVQGGRPVAALDENTTDHGGDPRVTWRGRRVQVSDFTESGDWAVDLAR